jgi:ParB/RepB/Spo0J family partition protein
MNDHGIQLKHYAIDDIELAPNPRPSDKIKPEAIDEMAESILEHGIIQPPSARLKEDGKPQLYIGQRRFFGLARALQMAEERSLDAAMLEKLRLMPLLVRVIDDRAMLEQQWIENLQREDVTARDEAQGFDFMQRTLGYTLDEIGNKIGKTKGYVSNRLKLMGAPDVLWKAFEEGRVGTRILELVGSIPHPKDREDAARAIIKPQFQDKPLTVLEATEMVGSKYVVSLRACGFDKEDPTLVKMEWKDGARCLGGACVGCPFLSKNDEDLACSLGGAVGNTGGISREGGAAGGRRRDGGGTFESSDKLCIVLATRCQK